MSEQYLGEIRIVSFNYPPKGWAFCNGQILPINQNQALFSLLGTTYGGDGRVNFALPNLQGRMPIHVSASDLLGTQGGTEAVTLGITELPTHTHVVVADAGVATATSPAGNLLAKKPRFGADVYAAPADLTALAGGSVGTVGGSQAHSNLQPFLALNFVIALQGIFPSRS